jgi:hypothetical protein
LTASHIQFLGKAHIDSGMTDSLVSLYLAYVDGLDKKGEPEEREAILGTSFLTPDELKAKILAGSITDGFTLQAFLLYLLNHSQGV